MPWCRNAYFEMSRFSMTNLTFDKVSALSSMAWLKPFSPPALHTHATEKDWSVRHNVTPYRHPPQMHICLA